MAYSK